MASRTPWPRALGGPAAGAELYQRLSVLGDHFAGVGKGLNDAVTACKAVGSLEGRVLVTARRFADMGVIGTGEKDIAQPITVDAATRALQSPELGGQGLRQLPPIDPMEALDNDNVAHERRAV